MKSRSTPWEKKDSQWTSLSLVLSQNTTKSNSNLNKLVYQLWSKPSKKAKKKSPSRLNKKRADKSKWSNSKWESNLSSSGLLNKCFTLKRPDKSVTLKLSRSQLITSAKKSKIWRHLSSMIKRRLYTSSMNLNSKDLLQEIHLNHFLKLRFQKGSMWSLGPFSPRLQTNWCTCTWTKVKWRFWPTALFTFPINSISFPSHSEKFTTSQMKSRHYHCKHTALPVTQLLSWTVWWLPKESIDNFLKFFILYFDFGLFNLIKRLAQMVWK